MVAAFARLVIAPPWIASKTRLLTKPTYEQAKPTDNRSSQISKLFPDQEVSMRE